MSFLKNFFVEEDGQDMVEYGLVVAALVVGGIALFTGYTADLQIAMGKLGTAVEGVL